MKLPSTCLIILFTLIITVNNSFCQDIIVLKTGEEILSEVEKVGTSEIEYKHFDNLNGPIYTKSLDEIFMIKYENGTKDVFNVIPKPISSETTQIVEKPKVEKTKKEFMIGPRIGYSTYSNQIFKQVYDDAVSGGLKVGLRFNKKVSVFFVYDFAGYNGIPVDEYGEAVIEYESLLRTNNYAAELAYGRIIFVNCRLGTTSLEESIYEDGYINKDNYLQRSTIHKVYFGIGAGFATDTKFQLFGEVNFDFVSLGETNTAGGGAFGTSNETWIRIGVLGGFRLKFGK